MKEYKLQLMQTYKQKTIKQMCEKLIGCEVMVS